MFFADLSMRLSSMYSSIRFLEMFLNSLMYLILEGLLRRFSFTQVRLVVRRNILRYSLLYTPSIIWRTEASSSLKFFSNSSKKYTQSKLKDDRYSMRAGFRSPMPLTMMTGMFNLLARTLAVTVLPVPFTPLNMTPMFPWVFS